MNGYERISAALKGVMPDRRPVMLHSFMLAVSEAGYSMKAYRTDPEIAAKCHIRFVEKYGVDGLLFDVDTTLLAGAVGVPVDFPENEPARTHDALLNSLDHLNALAEINLTSDPRIQHSLEAIRILKKYFGGEVFIRGNCDQAPFSLACSMRTPANFMMDLYMNEERATQLLEYTTRIGCQYVRLMAEAGADMVSNGDSPAGPSMISPAMYARFAYPYEKEVLKTAHSCNVPYLLHICGNTNHILQQLSTMDLDAVELDYQTPTERIYEHFSGKATLFGTIDPSGVLALGSPQIVKEESKRLLTFYKGNPRLVLGAGCAIPPIAPEENIRAIIQAAKEDELN